MMQEFLEFINKNFDDYTRRARLGPALLTVLPISLTVIGCFPNDYTVLAIITALGIANGGTALLAQIGRNIGKRKEAELFQSWGGKPTTQKLRHRNTSNKAILERRHKKLQLLIPDIHIPTLLEENSNPQEADEIYELCTKFLIDQTRDVSRFNLIFEENCSYGFHRNLWGLKFIGIPLSLIGTLIITGFIIYSCSIGKTSISPLTITSGVINFIFLLIWIFLITPDWVKPVAESYAERLLESPEKLLVTNATSQAP
ncbi:hypothetical protein [Anabaena azotica]|uniref:Uncharacterized protein n=1 Tax=Anabaena azotica FACHB-119 TaxID=947527 RepID=A0ABR8DHB0_9NOST|nr:hypothetical protein [Anabaena azotica]MBD2505148.1 hypothetical protein [Anabaena azotica FACHB-119]